MKPMDPLFKQHLSSGATTVCNCWIVKRTDGQVFGFTNHDQSIILDGLECEALTGLHPTEASEQLGLAVDVQEVDGVLHSSGITEADLNAGLYDQAVVEVWLVNWSSPDERMLQRTAILGEVARQDTAFTAELRGITSLLDQPIGRTYSRRCDVEVGSDKCGVDLSNASFVMSSSVTAIQTPTRFHCAGLDAFAKNWFAGGSLNWNSGANAGLSSQITSSAEVDDDSLTLWISAPSPISVGDTFNVTAGCDKLFETCKSKFSNHLNFRGCPHIPGKDFALGYAQTGVVHDGSPLVD